MRFAGVSVPHPYPELLREYHSYLGCPGAGLSHSSNRHILASVSQIVREHFPLADGSAATILPKVIEMSLERERSGAGGRAVGTDDVVPIALGGVGLLRTQPDGAWSWNRIDVDPEWIRDHFLLFLRHGGKPHSTSGQLGEMLSDRNARRYIADISAAAERAGSALSSRGLADLGGAVAEYVRLKAAWNPRYILAEAQEFADRLASRLGSGFACWKPPGSGGAASALVLVEADARDKAIEFAAAEGWHGFPVEVAEGLSVEVTEGGRRVRVSVPHRLDCVGASDLGIDPLIRSPGICCSMAVAPRSVLEMEFAEPILRR